MLKVLARSLGPATLISWLPILIALTVTSGCGDDTGPRVVVYTSVDRIYSEPVLASFAETSGIRVLPVFDVEATKTTGLVQRLIAEAEQPRADVFWNGEFAQTLVLAEQGLLSPYRSPAARDLPLEHVDEMGLWTGLGCRLRVLLVNRERLEPSAYPRSIFDLASAARNGRQLALAYPIFGTTATHAAAIYASAGAPAARAFFTDLRDSGVRVVDGNSVVRDLVAGGQIDAGLTDSDDACRAVVTGAPVALVIPDQDRLGTLLIPGSVAIIAGAPHPQPARRLIDYLVSRQIEQRLIEDGCFQLSLRRDGPRSPCLPESPIRTMTLTPEQIFQQLVTSRRELTEIFIR